MHGRKTVGNIQIALSTSENCRKASVLTSQGSNGEIMMMMREGMASVFDCFSTRPNKFKSLERTKLDAPLIL